MAREGAREVYRQAGMDAKGKTISLLAWPAKVGEPLVSVLGRVVTVKLLIPHGREVAELVLSTPEI